MQLSHASEPAIPVGDPEKGKVALDVGRCPECHGRIGDGDGRENGVVGTFPNLAGQRLDYLLKEFRDFREGRRKNDAMNVVAQMDDDEVIDILAYYASQKRHQAADAGDGDGMASALFRNGDSARSLPPCGDCHGATALGSKSRRGAAPALAGQESRYLDKQLRDWRSGVRRNSPQGVMNQIAQSLSDGEIEALSSWLAHQ